MATRRRKIFVSFGVSAYSHAARNKPLVLSDVTSKTAGFLDSTSKDLVYAHEVNELLHLIMIETVSVEEQSNFISTDLETVNDWFDCAWSCSSIRPSSTRATATALYCWAVHGLPLHHAAGPGDGFARLKSSHAMCSHPSSEPEA